MYDLPKDPASWGQLDGSLHGTIKMCTNTHVKVTWCQQYAFML